MVNILWTSYLELLKDYFGEFGLLRDHSREYVMEGLFRDHFGQWGMEALFWATWGLLWPVYYGRGILDYLGIILGSVLWKHYLGITLPRDHFG